MTTDTLANGLKAVFGSTGTPTSSSLIPYTDSSRNPAGFSSLSDLGTAIGLDEKVNIFDRRSLDGWTLFSMADSSFRLGFNNKNGQFLIDGVDENGVNHSFTSKEPWNQIKLFAHGSSASEEDVRISLSGADGTSLVLLICKNYNAFTEVYGAAYLLTYGNDYVSGVQLMKGSSGATLSSGVVHMLPYSGLYAYSLGCTVSFTVV